MYLCKSTGARDRLLSAAGTCRFEHTVAQLHEKRATAQAEAKAAQAYTENGFTVLEQRPESWDPAHIPLRYLVTTEGTEADDNTRHRPHPLGGTALRGHRTL